MTTKNTTSQSDDLRREYDLSKLPGVVSGKYYARATAGMTLVLLEPDVAEAYPDGESVNQALRALLRVARAHAVSVRVGKLPNKPLQPTSRAKRVRKRKTARAARG